MTKEEKEILQKEYLNRQAEWQSERRRAKMAIKREADGYRELEFRKENEENE